MKSLILLCALPVLAQTSSPAFQVASLRKIEPVNGMVTIGNKTAPAGQIHYTQEGPRNLARFISGNRLTIPTATLPGLIMDAFNVRQAYYSGLPSWATDSEFYTLTAKAPGDDPLTPEQARVMLQSLVMERFQLKVHRETRTLPAYELTIAKGGTKLREPSKGETPADSTAAPFGLIVGILQDFLDHPIIDKTGLAGKTYRFEWDQTALLEELRQGKPAPSIFSEAEAQLGLTLRPAKQESEFLVIDHVEKLAEN